MTDNTTQDRVPVSILTGFLGSGKTTLLSKLMQAENMDKVASFEPAHLRYEAGQQGVRCDVERHPETHIARALVHQARHLAIRDEKLAKHMAGRESHLVQGCGVPCTHDDTPI